MNKKEAICFQESCTDRADVVDGNKALKLSPSRLLKNSVLLPLRMLIQGDSIATKTPIVLLCFARALALFVSIVIFKK